MACNFLQHLWPQTTGSNSLVVSITCLAICLTGSPRAFCNFCNCINFQSRGPASRCICAHNFSVGFQRGPAKRICQPIYPTVYPFFHQSDHPSVHLLIFLSFWLSTLIFDDNSHDQSLRATHASADHGVRSPEWQ